MVSELLEGNTDASSCDAGKMLPKIRCNGGVIRMRNCLQRHVWIRREWVTVQDVLRSVSLASGMRELLFCDGEKDTVPPHAS